jgi:hypothetical protein
MKLLLVVGVAAWVAGAVNCRAETLSYPIVDTGQVRCYSEAGEILYPEAGKAFSGQDAQFTGIPFSFTDNGDGTVTDQNTGLMWQKVPSSRGFSWKDALAYAENCTHAGHDDWRLPTVKELQSIVDYSGVFPAVDSRFKCTAITNESGQVDFPYYWTSTSAQFSSHRPGYYYAWYVAFGYAVGQEGNDRHGAGAVRYDAKAEGGALVEGDG